MKRRNADYGKLRRPLKRNKITEGMYGSNTLLYMKFLVLWAIVITADFMLEFRFEFLWPFWLLLRSVHDSFKYKGLAFSVLFVCIAITSDLVCLFFIPVHWLFFAASTYVWVQYVWHTDKGICLPTIILWMLFVYLEAAIRWKDSRHIPHLDLCRPFAAHCIGYPVVTLGFGFKSYVGYRIRQRKQREVAKENEFYMQLLQQALPAQDETQETGCTNEQTGNQQDIQQKELTSVTGTTPNHNNNNLINIKNNAQTNNKHNINLFNNSNGHVVVTPFTSTSSPHLSNGVNIHNSNSHKNNNRKSLDKDSSCNSSNYLSNKLTDLNSLLTNSSSLLTSSCQKTNHNRLSNDNSTLSHVVRDKDREFLSNNHASGKKEHDISKHSIEAKTSDTHHTNGHCLSGYTKDDLSNKSHKHSIHNHQNGYVLNYDVSHEGSETMELHEKHKSGRKNRCKQKNNESTSSSVTNSCSTTSKDNQSVSNNQLSVINVSVQSISTHISQHQQTTSLICEFCLRLENEAKKMKQELNHLKQIENDLRQKNDANMNYKSCLQVKQREIDELEKRIQELTNSRQLDRQNLQSTEKRLGEERRQKQSFESQLNNERKLRKQTEERATRSECGELCKIKKQQLEIECKTLRRELLVIEEAKNSAEHQTRSYEQEMQKVKHEIRNREQQQGTEVLMSALNAMQVKNSTLEKNLSEETRVKLDLFSALGEVKRQLEIRENKLRTREKEVSDLQTKIAQLLAVMPCHDSLCMGSTSTSSTNSSSILRVNDTPPLMNQQQSQQQQGGQSSPMSHLGLSVSPLLGQLGNLGVLTTTPPPLPPISSSSSTLSSSVTGQVQISGSSGSNLDPNATAYTPKNNNTSMMGGTEA